MLLENKLYPCNQSLYQVHLSISAETIFWAAALALTWVCIKFVPLLTTTCLPQRPIHIFRRDEACPSHWNRNSVTALLKLRYESSTLILYKELSSSILQSLVSESVRDPRHLSRSPLCSLYKGTNALLWPSIFNYQLPPPPSVLYWPSTQLHYLVTHSWANWI